MHATPSASPTPTQEVPSTVAHDQLESAMSKRVEARAARTGVATVPQDTRDGASLTGALGFAGATFALSAGMVVSAALFRRRRRRAAARAEALRRAEEDTKARYGAAAREHPTASPRMIELPPHVVATLERLARERGETEAEDATRADSQSPGGRPGFEAWIS